MSLYYAVNTFGKKKLPESLLHASEFNKDRFLSNQMKKKILKQCKIKIMIEICTAYIVYASVSANIL